MFKAQDLIPVPQQEAQPAQAFLLLALGLVQGQVVQVQVRAQTLLQEPAWIQQPARVLELVPLKLVQTFPPLARPRTPSVVRVPTPQLARTLEQVRFPRLVPVRLQWIRLRSRSIRFRTRQNAPRPRHP